MKTGSLATDRFLQLAYSINPYVPSISLHQQWKKKFPRLRGRVSRKF